MGDYVALAGGTGEDRVAEPAGPSQKAATGNRSSPPRLASLDAFRGLSIALMIFVDYAGSILPGVAHSPWNGLRLADFVMPFFLFIVGISLSLVYKRIPDKIQATRKAMLRAVKLFLLGILLQGGYFHGINELTYGVDLEKIRFLGILQRIAIGYVIAALCEIWLASWTAESSESGVHKKYYLHWVIIIILSGIYLGLLYGLYVPSWQFKLENTSTNSTISTNYVIETVECDVRGDVGPACNSASMIDRTILGIQHLYKKPVYKNLDECKDSDDAPSWCLAPYDPEGILGSLMAAVTCIIGLQYGHFLVHFEDHKNRLTYWLSLSVTLLALGLILTFVGIPLNKSLYTTSYTLVTTATAGLTFCALYLLVDVYGQRWFSFVFEFMGRHSLSIFILIPSNLGIIAIQGFYWKQPKSNIVHWLVSFVVHN